MPCRIHAHIGPIRNRRDEGMSRRLRNVACIVVAAVLALVVSACGTTKIEGKVSECIDQLESLRTDETATVTVTGEEESGVGLYDAGDGKYIVTLTDDGEVDGEDYMHCHFDNPSDETLRKLKTGSRLTITGTVRGDSALLPHNIVDCKLN
jgi:hypothetical protein